MATPTDNLRAIVKDISLRSGLPMATVDHILHYQFGFLRDLMKSGSLKSIRLKYFGILGVKPGRKNFLQKNIPRFYENSKTESEE